MKHNILVSMAIAMALLPACKDEPAAESAARISVKETQVTLNERDGLTFSLEVTSNIPVAFELPAWIRQSGDAPATGTQTHSFTLTPLAGADAREGVITVKPADASHDKVSATVQVRQTNVACELRVATYNIRYINTADDNAGRGWNTRRTLVNQLVRTYDFDIFGVQEAQPTQLADILDAGSYSYIGIENGNNGEYCAIIYKTAKFDLLECGDFWYSETPGQPGRGWDGDCCNRICSWGKFREKTTWRTFYFFNSHYDYTTQAKHESAKLMVSKIKAITGSTYPVFATGDYNTNPTEAGVQYILEDGLLKDARAQSETTPAGTLGTTNDFSLSLEQMNVERRRIDFVFLTGDIRVKEYKTINDRPDGLYPSDHDPVLIRANF